jgi:endonuclease/exonuclease/phosphatase family metal-dependent hydrolase
MNEVDADILCGQESNQYIRDLIGKYYPYQHFIKKAGTTIYSRYPIIDKGQIDFGTVTNSCVWADVVVHTDTFRVYSAHLQSNKISSDAERLMEEAERDQQVDFINVRTILAKYKNYVGIRAHQATKIHRHMNESPYPVILAADLNDPPVSYTHRIATKGRKDAFMEAGKGLGITYAGKIPLLRIDNIILSEKIEVYEFQTIRKGYSDHYPLRVVVGNE